MSQVSREVVPREPGAIQKVQIDISRINPGRVFSFLVYYFIVMLFVSWGMSFLWFNSWVNVVITSLIALSTWAFIKPKPRSSYNLFQGIGKKAVIAFLLLSIVVAALNFIFFHDTFFGFRDEGIYACSAVYLSEHGEIGSLRNTNKCRHFLNTVWFAQLYGLVGFQGIKIANIIAFFLALTCIFIFVHRLSKSEWAAVIAAATIAFCYPVVWFNRRTCSEMLFFSLFWIAVYFSYRCYELGKPYLLDYVIAFLSFSLLAFLRLEGMVVLAIAILWAVYSMATLSKKNVKVVLFKGVLYLLLFIMLLCLITGTAYIGITHYNLAGTVIQSNLRVPGVSYGVPENSLDAHQPYYAAMAMMKFGLLPAVLFLIPFFFFLLKKKDTRMFGLFLLVMFLPFAYFFYRPNISFDFPCFLRRFISVSIPLSIIAFCYVVFKLKKAQAIVITLVFLCSTIVISAPILFRAEFKKTIVNVGRIADIVPDNARVVVDCRIGGYYEMSYPLSVVFGKNATKAVIPKHLDKIMEKDSTVYLVTNERNLRLIEMPLEMTVVEKLDFRYTYLRRTCELYRGMTEKKKAMRLDYRVALARIKVPSRFITETQDIVIVKLELKQE